MGASSSVIIHAYIQTWNEIVLMPYLLRHYGSFCDRLIFNDDNSTDGTREAVEACPIAELRNLGADGLNEEVFLQHWNNDYKGSRGVADWVILADGDEFLYHPDMRGLLTDYKARGITLPRGQGYIMVSDRLPTTDGQIYDEFVCGSPACQFDKRSVFDPGLDISFTPGRHNMQTCSQNAVDTPVPEIALLHYGAMGFDYYNNRHLSYQSRMSATNIEHGWGSYIFSSEEGRRGAFEAGVTSVRPVGEHNLCIAVEAFKEKLD